MARVLALVGASAGGALGWWIGDHVGLMTAFMLGIIGTGAGLYYGGRIARHYWG